MKYRTVIELICEAADKEDAFHTAGEYLRGEVESGVEMKCKAISLKVHRMLRYGIASVLVVFLFSTLAAGIATRGREESLRNISELVLSNTCTIQPVLHTKHKTGFKEKWETKKDEAILEYLKK
jgi:hypothetical protein